MGPAPGFKAVLLSRAVPRSTSVDRVPEGATPERAKCVFSVLSVRANVVVDPEFGEAVIDEDEPAIAELCEEVNQLSMSGPKYCRVSIDAKVYAFSFFFGIRDSLLVIFNADRVKYSDLIFFRSSRCRYRILEVRLGTILLRGEKCSPASLVNGGQVLYQLNFKVADDVQSC